MVPIAYEVVAVYGALAIWSVLLLIGIKRKSYRAFILFGIAVLLFLNVRYFIEGAPASIAFFIGIYDVFDNLGLAPGEGAAALAACPDNACTVWGDRYLNHPSWGVAFHDRFLNAPEIRTWLLYAHLGLNSLVFIIMHWQLARPGFGENRTMHRVMGKVAFVLLTIGTICAVVLAAQHGPVGAYGGLWSMLGFWSMSLCVYGCAVMGVVAARRGDLNAHRKWMFRFIGSMWGAFWLFRLMLVVTGPSLRDYESASLLISIWLSAPLGILLAEIISRHRQRKAPTKGTVMPA